VQYTFFSSLLINKLEYLSLARLLSLEKNILSDEQSSLTDKEKLRREAYLRGEHLDDDTFVQGLSLLEIFVPGWKGLSDLTSISPIGHK